MIYDALKIPAGMVEGDSLVARGDAVLAIAEPLLGVIRGGRKNMVIGGRRAYVRDPEGRGAFFVSTDPVEGEFHRVDGDRAHRPRYDWSDLGDGMKGGTLRAD